MATRHQSRESVITLLYALDLGNDKIDKFVDEILEDKKIRNKQKDFALSLFNGVKSNLSDIDDIIISQLKDWTIKDLGSIEKAILRLGTYELREKKLDTAIIINESIELAKNLGGDNAPKFINGVMDSINRSMKQQIEG